MTEKETSTKEFEETHHGRQPMVADRKHERPFLYLCSIRLHVHATTDIDYLAGNIRGPV